MRIAEILNGIYYAGVNDRTSPLFENLWSLPNGVSYNSYIVKGEKIALIDTVHISQSNKFISNLKNIIGDAKVEYLVINHMEPDHSGAISSILNIFPEIKIVGNKKTIEMINGFYGICNPDNFLEIKDGDTLDLGGGKTLKFVITPMVHWPETMMTYETSTSAIFTGDAFGCYGALNGGTVDVEIDVEPYIPEMYRYYSNIVAKYGIFVQKALAKLKGLHLEMICPTHGPVWKDYMMHVLDLYDRLSKYEPEDGVVIVYGSMYGNTEEAAELIADEIVTSGYKNIKMYNICKADLSSVISDICRYKGLIIGCPTYSNGIFPPIENLLNAIVTRELKNKVFASFGSYTWAPGISKKIKAITEKLNFDVIDESFEIKQSMKDNDYENIVKMSSKFIEKMKN